jgi:hypothetical protein
MNCTGLAPLVRIRIEVKSETWIRIKTLLLSYEKLLYVGIVVLRHTTVAPPLCRPPAVLIHSFFPLSITGSLELLGT